MDPYVTGSTISELRKKKGITQKQLADNLCVSDKAVSKWETGHGLPDITLLQPLAEALGVSLAELAYGQSLVNTNTSGNLRRSCFYVCPVCGNVLWSMGQGAFSCCGILLPQLEAEPAEEQHSAAFEEVENEWFLNFNHPMEKTHSISFVACVASDSVLIRKLYPEQDAAVRFPRLPYARFYAYCNRHGLFTLIGMPKRKSD